MSRSSSHLGISLFHIFLSESSTSQLIFHLFLLFHVEYIVFYFREFILVPLIPVPHDGDGDSDHRPMFYPTSNPRGGLAYTLASGAMDAPFGPFRQLHDSDLKYLSGIEVAFTEVGAEQPEFDAQLRSQ